MGIARAIYEKTKIGATGVKQAAATVTSAPPDYVAFQDVVNEFDDLEAQGRIKIIEKIPESQTGMRYVAFVSFERLK